MRASVPLDLVVSVFTRFFRLLRISLPIQYEAVNAEMQASVPLDLVVSVFTRFFRLLRISLPIQYEAVNAEMQAVQGAAKERTKTYVTEPRR